MAEESEGVCCPSCSRLDIVKNGKVRGTQRFRCKSCRLNFVDDPKHRWPPDSKLLNVLIFVDGQHQPRDGAEAARVDRWLLEAKEHHDWFIRALAQHAVFAAITKTQPIDEAIAGAWGLYAFITKRDPAYFYDVLATELYCTMARIGGDPFQDELIAWLSVRSPDLAEAAAS